VRKLPGFPLCGNDIDSNLRFGLRTSRKPDFAGSSLERVDALKNENCSHAAEPLVREAVYVELPKPEVNLELLEECIGLWVLCYWSSTLD